VKTRAGLVESVRLVCLIGAATILLIVSAHQWLVSGTLFIGRRWRVRAEVLSDSIDNQLLP